MNRKKVILSIFLMILLVLAGIVLPALWEMEKQDSETDAESIHISETDNEASVPVDHTSELEYIGFDKLADFFPDNQTEDFKAQFPAYFKQTGQTAVSSVEFLPGETGYPDKDTTLFQFSLSDGTLLPVTYSASSGAFFFGEEKLQIAKDGRTYPRQTDDTLGSVTTEEIEARQEGGYADTADDSIEETPGSSNTVFSETDASATSDAKEVRP